MPPKSQAPVRYLNLRDIVLGRFLGVIALVLMTSLSAARAVLSVTLAWNASPGPDVAGYKVYYSTNGNSLPPLNVGNVTTATIPNLSDATTYVCWVTAYNSLGLESQPSNQVSYTTPSSNLIKYTLTVIRGSGSGPYPTGTYVPVSADLPDPGEEFAYWDGDTSILQLPRTNPDNEAFIPLRDVTITAVYSPLPAYGTGLRGQ
jgi:hypothetical protein